MRKTAQNFTRRERATETLANNYSTGGIVPAALSPYSRNSKYGPSDTHPPRQVPGRLNRLDPALAPRLLRACRRTCSTALTHL